VTLLACYVSGHGFGHATRTIEVLRALRALHPEIELSICSPVDRWFFDLNLGGRFEYRECRLDVGAVQSDSVTVDPEGSLRAYTDLVARGDALVAGELREMARCRPAAVFADIPALAFDIAAALGVPGVAMTNFSWDWIYADYAADFPAYRSVVEQLRASYGRADLLLRLPLYGDLSAFPRVRDLPLVARRSQRDAAEVRALLGLPFDRRVVLLSFGGIGLGLDVAPRRSDVVFVSTQTPAGGAVPPGCAAFDNDHLAALGLRYEDLVAASDAVITKPGYGIVAECIANATPMIYTSRGRFAEYPILVRGIEAHLPNAFLGNEDLRAGHWSEAIDAILAQPRPTAMPRIDGAEVAANILADYLR
jgi:hypothetical protein